MSALSVEGLSVVRGGRPVLSGLDLAVGAGEVLAVVGPNGAGKTTLLQAALRLLPREGRVLVAGRDSARLSRRDLARLAAYVPQAKSVDWPLGVEETVALGRLPFRALLGPPSTEDRQAVDRALARAACTALRGRRVTELSGGERTRVLLARALASETALLLVDEPVSGLDPRHQLGVMELLADLAREGRTVVCVLHDLALAARFATRVLLLNGPGRAIVGASEEVLAPERLAAVYGIEALSGSHEGSPFILPWKRTAQGAQ
ncbi:MAG: ABC transporter ATP-binding protein [Alphaproteobacteria bacterium]|nr:ABC transporter ATP-binding protein [Alphaproteobacteria bacterium]